MAYSTFGAISEAMRRFGELYRRQMAPVLIRLWPSIDNPAWRSSAAAKIMADDLRVSLSPERVAKKFKPASVQRLRRTFLTDNLGDLPTDRLDSLYTYRDVAEIALHRADYRATRLYGWFRASIDAGRPVFARGVVVDSDEKIERYYRMYLDMLLSLEANGYEYAGDDEMCFGITASREFVLVRRGTHRLAAAQILGLSAVSGIVTHVDRAFAEACLRKHPDLKLPAAIAQGIREAAIHP